MNRPDVLFTQMIIVEAVGDKEADSVTEIMRDRLRKMMDAETASADPQLASWNVLLEEDGRMVVCTTSWISAESRHRFVSTRSYRLPAEVAPLVIGDPVVKLFKTMDYGERAI